VSADASSMTPVQRRFVNRVTITCAWGEGVDGFDLGILSVVLTVIATELNATPVELGLIGASSLIGLFFGAPLIGILSDRFGRKNLFTIDLILFVILGGLQAVVQEPWQLFVVRVLLGVTIGAEYSLGAAMLAEFVPSHGRGTRMGSMLCCWYVGYLMAVAGGFALRDLAGWNWRWILAFSAVPAILTLLMRIGIPESPRWLKNNGQEEKARAIVDKYLGESYYHAEALDDESVKSGGIAELFKGENFKRLAFCCVMWAANVGPFFAIFTFAPSVLESLNIQNEVLGTIILNSFAALGAILGMLALERFGRRKQTLFTFAVTTPALAIIGIWSNAPAWVVVALFAAFALCNAAQGNLTVLYPAEILPTEVRATGVGVAAAFSRLSAAAGTFLLPIGIESIGTAPMMLIFAGVLLIGWIYSHFEAPETTGMTLTSASHGKLEDLAHQHVEHGEAVH
jgi:MFS transporter, putative metabolite transport protein